MSNRIKSLFETNDIIKDIIKKDPAQETLLNIKLTSSVSYIKIFCPFLNFFRTIIELSGIYRGFSFGGTNELFIESVSQWMREQLKDGYCMNDYAPRMNQYLLPGLDLVSLPKSKNAFEDIQTQALYESIRDYKGPFLKV